MRNGVGRGEEGGAREQLSHVTKEKGWKHS